MKTIVTWGMAEATAEVRCYTTDPKGTAMLQTPVLVDLTAANVEQYACCGAKDPAHEGRRRKIRWMKAQFKKGLRARVLLTDAGEGGTPAGGGPAKGRQAGYIEYMPGEHAWRGVEAGGYLVIQCIWIHYKEYQRKGVGSAMVEAAMEDARRSGMHGVAAVVRDGPWMAGSALFVKNGFKVADEAAPDYRLLVKKLDASAPDPKFRFEQAKALRRYGSGLTIIRSDQCPYAAKFGDDIADAAREEYGIEPRVVEVKTLSAARGAPTPDAAFAIVYNGRLVADHQISRTRFRNLMKEPFSGGKDKRPASGRPRRSSREAS